MFRVLRRFVSWMAGGKSYSVGTIINASLCDWLRIERGRIFIGNSPMFPFSEVDADAEIAAAAAAATALSLTNSSNGNS